MQDFHSLSINKLPITMQENHSLSFNKLPITMEEFSNQAIISHPITMEEFIKLPNTMEAVINQDTMFRDFTILLATFLGITIQGITPQGIMFTPRINTPITMQAIIKLPIIIQDFNSL